MLWAVLTMFTLAMAIIAHTAWQVRRVRIEMEEERERQHWCRVEGLELREHVLHARRGNAP